MAVHLRNATVLSGGGNWTAERHIDLLVVDGVIAAMGHALESPPDSTVLDASALILAPAFVNAHTHSPEMLGRGLCAMGDQSEWLSVAYSDGRDALSDADIARSIRLCAADIVRGGAVRVTDHFRQNPPRVEAVDAAARAWASSGLQARIAMNLRDRVAPGGGLVAVPNSSNSVLTTAEVLSFVREVLDRSFAVPVGVGPSAPQRVTDEFLTGVSTMARERGTFLHMHLCESRADAATCRELYGTSAVRHLDRLGVLGPETELPHSVHVDDSDLDLIADKGAIIVHNPVANLRLGSGVAPIARALVRGIDVALGSDGAGSNGSQSLLEAAKFALLAPRAVWPASEWITPAQVLTMATRGARVAAGQPADLIAFDAGASAFLDAEGDLSSRIVLAAQPTDLVHVMGSGEFLMRDRVVCLR